MKDIKKDIDQLEFAGELIDRNSPTTSRLALFLIDNLAELIMHRNVMYEFARDKQHELVIPRKYSPKKEYSVKKDFYKKVNFLVNDLKKIGTSDEFVLKVGHYLRNEAYHNGILRERIILPITRTYFQTICNIYPTLWIHYYRMSHYEEKEVREFFSKYRIKEGLIDQNDLAKICSNILQGRECKQYELAKSISEDLVVRLQETLNDIGCIGSEEPNAMSPSKLLKWLQYRKEGGMEHVVAQTYEVFWKMVEDKLADFQTKVTLHTFKVWLKKAKAIQNEKDKGTILQKFWEIDKQFLKIQNLFSEAVCEYNMKINSQIH